MRLKITLASGTVFINGEQGVDKFRNRLIDWNPIEKGDGRKGSICNLLGFELINYYNFDWPTFGEAYRPKWKLYLSKTIHKENIGFYDFILIPPPPTSP